MNYSFRPLIKKTQIDPKDLVNYRPISNLPFLSKILEKVVYSQLYSLLEKIYICEDFQSGFRPSHSTETALIRVTHDLLLSSDRVCISLLGLLDLSTAVDTIDHNIVFNRLEYWIFVGINGSALAWFKSYLSDRHQFVAVNEEVSYRSQVQYGVPQGSVIGSLLFTLYMLPLGNIIRDHGVSFYADDTQLYISSQPGETYQIEKLMECIIDIKNWMTSNFLLLNSDKKRYLHFISSDIIDLIVQILFKL